MRYQVGGTGRVILARFEDGDDILGGLTDIARKESVNAGVVYLVGGVKAGQFVVGPETEDLPPKPVWRAISESHEALGFGTIFPENGEPKVHLHGAFGKRDMVKVGCLRKDSATFLVLEAVIIEITGVTARRELDPRVGMSLLKV